MKRIIVLLTASLVALLPAGAFGFRWKQLPVDGSRTGVTCPSASNVPETMGGMKGRAYVAPNGRVFKGRSATAKVARLMLNAQPGMAEVKEVIGFCPTGLERGGDESLLGDWAVDALISAAEKEFGVRPDIGLLNHGGIRIDMPQGEVLMDDLMSMFPFKNYLCMVTMKGSEVRALFERMGRRPQVLGGDGLKFIVKDGEVLELLVGGKPIDDGRLYTVATIDFLLTGGDGVFSGRQFEQTRESELKVFDVMLAHVRELTSAGKPIAKERDGRVDDLTERRRR